GPGGGGPAGVGPAGVGGLEPGVSRRQAGILARGRRTIAARAARAATVTVSAPRGSTAPAPPSPTSGAATPPKPYRAIPSSEEAVPAFSGCAPSASAVRGGAVAETAATRTNRQASTAATGRSSKPAASSPSPLTVRTAMPRAIIGRSPQRRAVRPPSWLNTITATELTPKA